VKNVYAQPAWLDPSNRSHNVTRRMGRTNQEPRVSDSARSDTTIWFNLINFWDTFGLTILGGREVAAVETTPEVDLTT